MEEDPLFVEPKFDKSDTITIIHLYRSHPVLWDIKNSEYRRQDLKTKAYNDIARRMNMSVESVKKKIKSLRSTYTGEKRKMFLSKAKPEGERYLTSLSWYGEMTFLDSFSPIRKTVESILDDESDRKRKYGEDEDSLESHLKADFKKERMDEQSVEIDLAKPQIINRPVKRYMVQIPKTLLTISTADKEELHQRYTSLGIPSDFFLANIKWSENFTTEKPFSLSQPCQFHIKAGRTKFRNKKDLLSIMLEKDDTNYLYSAKVMLLDLPAIEEIYEKCFENDNDSTHRPIHPWRLIKFLVGMKGDEETIAIGGPWLEELDGENPDKDPSVLIRTAIRTCKALTGINLARCTQWHRFLEIYYHRQDADKQDDYVETVVFYLPDVHLVMPNEAEWQILHNVYGVADTGNKVQMIEKATLSGKGRNESIRKEPITKTVVIKDDTNYEISIFDDNGDDSDDELETRIESVSTDDEYTDSNILKDEQKASSDKNTFPVTPHIIVRPNIKAKGGNFNCAIKSLSTLLDYKPDDLRESSFEISLFAELFNDMLMRDFGCNILKEINKFKASTSTNKVCEITIEENYINEITVKENDIKDEIKMEFIDDNDDENSNDDYKFENFMKKNDMQAINVKTTPIYNNIINPKLLLSCVYFDTSHSGYIYRKDLEDLFSVLGVNMRRKQIQKVLEKLENIDMSDALNYRKLTHKEKSLECTSAVKVVNMANFDSADEDDGEKECQHPHQTHGDDSSTDSDDNISLRFSDKEIILTLIEEYAKLPQLLNTTIEKLHNYKSKQKYNLYKYLTNNINMKLKLNLSLNKVQKKLIFVCNLYESEIERRLTGDKEANSGYQWLYDKLNFLQPLIENKLKQKLKLLDDHHLYDIIDVYKDYRSLWDIHHPAFFHKTKRAETMRSLLDGVRKRVHLPLDICQLDKQLTYIHRSFARDNKLRLECETNDTVFQPTFSCFYMCYFLKNHESPFKCPICDFTTESKYLYKTHSNEHLQKKSFSCSKCNKKFNTSQKYEYHRKKHSNDLLLSKKLRCKYCIRMFETEEECDVHAQSHTRLCNICNSSFTHDAPYLTHMKWHEEKDRYFCHICQEGFFLKLSLQNHIKRHVAANDKVCNICNTTFLDSLSLFWHAERAHRENIVKK